MKQLKHIIIIICIIVNNSCQFNNIKQGSYNNSEAITIKVYKKPNNFLQVDSLFEKITVIPLETNESCLISKPKKVLFRKTKIYIQDFYNHLYQFNSNGKFIKEIGKKGRGPGEYIQMAGFDIDENDNIYIIDMVKVLMYNSNGKFIKCIDLNLDIECYPEQIIIDKSLYDGLYIWGGTISIEQNRKQNKYALYQVNNQGKIVQGFFPLKHKITNNLHRFRKHKDYYNIEPIFGSNKIYKICKNGVVANYIIDFGKYTLLETVPDNFHSLAKFKKRISNKYATNIRRFVETEHWIYFAYTFENRFCNAFYSKKTKKHMFLNLLKKHLLTNLLYGKSTLIGEMI